MSITPKCKKKCSLKNCGKVPCVLRHCLKCKIRQKYKKTIGFDWKLKEIKNYKSFVMPVDVKVGLKVLDQW